MLRKAKDLIGYNLSALDGEIGAVQDFYFDDQSWTVRYLVANTGGWLGERTILISPHALPYTGLSLPDAIWSPPFQPRTSPLKMGPLDRW